MMDKHTCKHYNGLTAFRQGNCRAGVCYRDVTPDPDGVGCALRLPCHNEPMITKDTPPDRAKVLQENFDRRGKCDKLEPPTDAEIAEHEREMKAAIARMGAAFPMISKVKKAHKGEDWRGVEECPICKGKLHMTHAKYNGHVWGQCETQGCLSWME